MTTNLALSAHDTVTTETSTVCNKKGKAMKNFSFLAALVAVPLALVTTGCGMDDNSEEPLGVSLTVTAKAKECAAEAGAPDCSKIEFCVQHVVNAAEAVNPTVTGTCIPMNLTSGEATGTFASLPEPGSFSVGFKNLPEGYHVKYTMGGFETDDVVELNQGSNSLNVVLGTDGTTTPNSGPGNVTIDAIKDNGDAVTNCAWNFNSDQLDAVCVVKPEGVSCNNIAAGNYTVDVSCDDKKLIKTGYAFEVIPTVTTAYTVIVTTAGSTGSGKGNLCVKLVDKDGNPIDETACESYKVNGVSVSSVFDDPDCEDAMISGLAKGTSTVEVTCGNAEGSLVTEVAEDATSDVTVQVKEPAVTNNDGFACFKVSQGPDHLTGCTFDFFQLPVDPTPSANPPAGCDGVGDYYFKVPANEYKVTVTCNNVSVQAEADVVANATETVPVVFPATVSDGDMCVQKMGLPLDLDTLSTDMSLWLGYGDAGSCVHASPTQLAAMTVVDFHQYYGPGTCTTSSDAGCAITISGLVVSMKPNAFDDYEVSPPEKRYFDVEVTDGVGTTHVLITTKNGYYQP